MLSGVGRRCLRALFKEGTSGTEMLISELSMRPAYKMDSFHGWSRVVAQGEQEESGASYFLSAYHLLTVEVTGHLSITFSVGYISYICTVATKMSNRLLLFISWI